MNEIYELDKQILDLSQSDFSLFTSTPKLHTLNPLQPPSHFRYYVSSIGRFLKPDNIILNAYNPQSWNLYTYVNGNPVNFNDPMGHYCKAGSTSQVLFGQGGALGLSAAYGGIWENPQLQGPLSVSVDNISGYSTQKGIWAPIYNSTASISDSEVVWDENLQAWVGSEMTVSGEIIGWRWVEVDSESQYKYGQYISYSDRRGKLENFFVKNSREVERKIKAPANQRILKKWAALAAGGAMLEVGILGVEQGSQLAFVNPLAGFTVMAVSAVPLALGTVIILDAFFYTGLLFHIDEGENKNNEKKNRN